jgi:hypothetical protein
VLNPAEKAYFGALQALRHKDYLVAKKQFDVAAPHFADQKEFNLLRETTRLLVEVKRKLGTLTVEERLEIKESFTSG